MAMGTSEFFSEMALELYDQPSTEQTVDLITKFAQSAIGGSDSGIMLVHARQRIETAASTSPRVEESHELQRTHDEGPCLDALEGVGSYLSNDVAQDERWPTWGRAVEKLGIRSAISVRLETRQRRYGSLNIYADDPDAFTPEDLAVAEILGRHASVALAASHSEDGLMSAIDARKLIGQAQGILMERFDLDSDRAFDVLRRYSQDGNRKLRDVAEAIVRHRGSSVGGAPTA
ncbi:GAF and ANTAR domain-containing protein [Aeromicrobium piscarium]|uniref:GAF and ANTAR domain-containing protein n=2 Tax=Aeromicrobium piscarium TaxID=2590901 RepID=A0A554SDL4_9ACTN|nr:GAF and ANTAR domain-containing protein [Aeromicrobium piscarium]